MSDHRDSSDTQPRAAYVPTLGEYAEVIHWLVANPNEEIPKELRRVFDDAIDRAELRHFARTLAGTIEDGFYTEPADWQMRWWDAMNDVVPSGPKREPQSVGGAHFELIAVDEIHDWVPYPESIVMGLSSSHCGSCNKELGPLGEDLVCPHCGIDFHFLRPNVFEQMTESDLDAMQDVADATGLQLIR